jgi:hypothetical protein
MSGAAEVVASVANVERKLIAVGIVEDEQRAADAAALHKVDRRTLLGHTFLRRSTRYRGRAVAGEGAGVLDGARAAAVEELLPGDSSDTIGKHGAEDSESKIFHGDYLHWSGLDVIMTEERALDRLFEGWRRVAMLFIHQSLHFLYQPEIVQ